MGKIHPLCCKATNLDQVWVEFSRRFSGWGGAGSDPATDTRRKAGIQNRSDAGFEIAAGQSLYGNINGSGSQISAL